MTKRQQCLEQTRATRHQLFIYRRYGTTAYGCRDEDNEGENGLRDECPRRAGVKRPWRASPSFPFLAKFHMPQIEAYDKSKDPLDHLESFKTLMHLQGVLDEIICWAFPTTLKGPARIWFSRLTPNSIGTFKELSAQFASQFIGGHKYKKSTTCLMIIK